MVQTSECHDPLRYHWYVFHSWKIHVKEEGNAKVILLAALVTKTQQPYVVHAVKSNNLD
jgi:hypothetical protein